MSRFTSNYSWLESNFGKAMEAHQEFGKALREAGPLSDRDAQLIQLAGAAAIRSEGGVHSHARRALEAGAQPEEIYTYRHATGQHHRLSGHRCRSVLDSGNNW